jgi:hypothetical protein
MKSKVYSRKVDAQDELLDHIKERQDALRQATRHVLTQVVKCIYADGGIFENVLY